MLAPKRSLRFTKQLLCANNCQAGPGQWSFMSEHKMDNIPVLIS